MAHISRSHFRCHPRTLRAAKTLGDDICFCFLLSFLKLLGGKAPVYSLSLSSFPNVVVGNLLFVVAVILESRSPGSVVIKQGKIVPLFGLYTQNDRLIYPRTLRAGSLRAAKTLGDDICFCFLQSFLERSVLFSSCPYCHSRKLQSGICCLSLPSS